MDAKWQRITSCRQTGPALINVKYKRYWWYLNGKWHRLDGPAYINEEDKIY